MKKQKAIVMQFLLFLLIITACKKEELNKDTPPPITQEGLNTFGCLINGEVFVPKDSPGTFMGSGPIKGLRGGISYYSEELTYFSLTAIDLNLSIYLYIPKLEIEGEFKIGASNGRVGFNSPENPHIFIVKKDGSNPNKIYLSSSESGKIRITRIDDTVVAGTFEVTVFNQANISDSLVIVEGRFDINRYSL